jgi:hypothetical protein
MPCCWQQCKAVLLEVEVVSSRHTLQRHHVADATRPLRPLLLNKRLPCVTLLLRISAGLRGPLPDSLSSLTRLWTLDIVGTSMRCSDTTQQPPPCPVPSWLVQQVCEGGQQAGGAHWETQPVSCF